MKIIFSLIFAFCVSISQNSFAGAFSAVRAAPVVTPAITSSGQAIVQVAQPYTFTAAAAANSPFVTSAANAAQYALGSGAGSPAAQIAQAALGVAGAAAGVVASPALGTLVGALTIGAAGYALYQEIKKQGVTINPDGSGSFDSAANWYPCVVGYCWAAKDPYVLNGITYIQNCGSGFGYYGYPVVCYTPATTPKPTPSPLTNTQLVDAINNAVTSPTAAVDAVSLAQQKNINPLSYFPSTQPNLNPAPYTVSLPDGTVVSVTPSSTLGGQDLISPTPTTSTVLPSTNPAPSQSITLPTDYARQGEAGAAADKVIASINPLTDAVNAKGADASLPLSAGDAAKTLSQQNADGLKHVTDSLGGANLPSLPAWMFPHFAPATCAPIGYTYKGFGVMYDICPHVPSIKSIEAWILNLIAAAIAFSMLMNFRAMRVKS